ncbi:NAD(P)-binding protein [Aspergillus leporis]|jgi:nucleoside-diphosphate-sugar epimerase|uniref:NAD(P)-binding protein n=1 Tax=Aspergillus leporis TaxID=41062 RepID=A0A5N5WIF9_9EURO|nr:NAD(P)-binding protein [Aspergillus leporis]
MAQTFFVTGGSGFIGSVVVEQAVADGNTVHALSRSETSDEKLRKLGAVPIRGDLTSLDVLRVQSAAADAVIHMATAYVLGQGTYEDVRHIDVAAVDAIADGLAGSDKALIVTNGTLCVPQDPSGAETTEETPTEANPLNTRVKTEEHSLGLVSRGIRAMVVRIPPYTYGRGGSGVTMFMKMAKGSMTCVDGGKNRISSVYVDDAARLYLLAVKKGRAGDIFNAVASTTVTAREVFGAIADALGVPLIDMTEEEAQQKIGPMFTFFLKIENRASGAKAREVLGWEPKGPGLVNEIANGSYQAVAAELRE